MFTKTSKGKAVYLLITEQIRDVEACLLYFESFMKAACTPATVHETLKSLAKNVADAEAKADISLRKMIDSLGSAYLPSTREDLISIATSCDKIANKCESVSNRVVLQRFSFPEEYSEDILDMLSVTHEQFEILETCIGRMFASLGDFLKDHSLLDEVRRKETAVDIIEQKLYEQIYGLDLDLAHKMQLAQYIEMLADISDIIENIADKIQIMLITRKA